MNSLGDRVTCSASKTIGATNFFNLVLNKLILQFAYVEGMKILCGESCISTFFCLIVQERQYGSKS